MWNNNNDLSEDFDIIVEDGLHTFKANVCFFENSIHKLKPNGYYIIEDIVKNEIPLFNNKIDKWRKMYTHLNFTLLKIKSIKNSLDNNLIVIHYTN